MLNQKMMRCHRILVASSSWRKSFSSVASVNSKSLILNFDPKPADSGKILGKGTPCLNSSSSDNSISANNIKTKTKSSKVSREKGLASEESVSGVPHLAFCGPIRYIRTPAQAEKVCRELSKKEVSVLGVDAEWNAVWRKGREGNKTALLQIAWVDASREEEGSSSFFLKSGAAARGSGSVESLSVGSLKNANNIRVDLFHLKHMKSFPQALKELLENKSVLKVGAHVKGDCGRLVREGRLFGSSSTEDLEESEEVTKSETIYNDQCEHFEDEGRGVDSFTSYFGSDKKAYDTSDWIEIERLARKRIKLEKYDLVGISLGLFGHGICKEERLSNWEVQFKKKLLHVVLK